MPITASLPLPSISLQPAGRPTNADNACTSRPVLSAGYRLMATRPSRSPSACCSAAGRPNGFSIASSLTMPAASCTA